MFSDDQTRDLLDWHIAMGIDETISDLPFDSFTQPKPAAVLEQGAPHDLASAPQLNALTVRTPATSRPVIVSPAAPPPSSEASVRTATKLAAAANTFDDLQTALLGFDGCALKRTATSMVVADGNPAGRVLFIGEAPGAEEDRQGKPFVGPSGQLLDKMLKSICLDRSQVLISNTVFWRPPGNRTPTTTEVATCLPFIQRMVELMMPEVIVPLGGPAAKSLLEQTAGIGKLRGHWFTYTTVNLSAPIAVTPLFHPAYLLRTPAQKRPTWRDLLMIRQRLDGLDGT